MVIAGNNDGSVYIFTQSFHPSDPQKSFPNILLFSIEILYLHNQTSLEASTTSKCTIPHEHRYSPLSSCIQSTFTNYIIYSIYVSLHKFTASHVLHALTWDNRTKKAPTTLVQHKWRIRMKSISRITMATVNNVKSILHHHTHTLFGQYDWTSQHRLSGSILTQTEAVSPWQLQTIRAHISVDINISTAFGDVFYNVP